MAKAIARIPEMSPHEVTAGNSEPLASAHQDSLTEALRLLDLMNDKGLLRLLIAVLEKGEDALRIFVEQADKPGAVAGIQNGMLLLQGLSELDPNGLQRLFRGLGNATSSSSAEAVSINGVFDMLRLFHDPDVTAGLSFAVSLLKGIGQEVRQTAQSEASS